MKYCTHCGQELNDNDYYCFKCGNQAVFNIKELNTLDKQDKTSDNHVTKENQSKDINIFALLGFIFSFVSAVIGLVFGIIGLNKCKEDNERGEGLAKAAIIISTVSIVLSIIAVIVYIILLFSGIITMFSLVPHPVVQ